MKMIPLHHKILVRRDESLTSTDSGIVLPGQETKSLQGEVVAVGNGKLLSNGNVQPMSLKVGERVIFGKYMDQNQIESDGEMLIIMDETDIFGVLE